MGGLSLVGCGTMLAVPPSMTSETKPATSNSHAVWSHMMTLDDGWGTRMQNTHGQMPIIVRTTNGAHTWQPAAPAGMHPALVDFFSPAMAWAAITSRHRGYHVQIERTLNGGDGWRQTDKLTIPINLSASSLQFINRQDGFLLFSGSASYPPVYQAAALYATTDGGQHWSAMSRTANHTMPRTGIKMSMSFVTPSLGWMIATGPLGGAGKEFLWTTTNGGRMWTFTVLPAPPGYTIHNLIDIGTPQRLSASQIVFPSIWRRTQAAQSLVATEHWSAAHPTWQTTVGTGTAALRTPIQTSELTPGIIAWSFLTPQRGWMVIGSTIYRTTTGGHAWTAIGTVSGITSPDSIHFVTPHTGWLLGTCHSPHLVVERTTNGGRTWSPS